MSQRRMEFHQLKKEHLNTDMPASSFVELVNE
jgi:hypothetical protein